MTKIVDASVALKWVLEEDGSEAAQSIVLEEMLAAPDLLFVECANVLCVKVRRGVISRDDAVAALRAIESAPVRSIPSRAHTAAAQALAFELEQTAYDCLYLAVAIAERAVLTTADEAFFRAVEAHPVYGPWIERLA
jgi:predicted nucleic acid-binding protein